jgi:valine--pyruvate aminotransferase
VDEYDYMEFSNFGKKFTEDVGILSLMKDMGDALKGGAGDIVMMGGGNPGSIPSFERLARKRLNSILSNEKEFQRLIGIYSPPQGESGFIESLAGLLRKEYGWQVGPENICLTNGSQSAFFVLFNMFAGEFGGGKSKKICLPMAPEYIGYADIGLTENFFVSHRPRIEYLEEQMFKYRVDFEELSIGEGIGAICVSRPTNPTGNVVTDNEISQLDTIAKQNGIPLIIDNAYGVPFPGIVFSEAHPIWNENIIVCLSLSKLGLPAARTGIVVANKRVIKAVSGMNAVMALAPGNFGAALAHEMIESGEIIDVSQNIIKPFYKEKSDKARAYIQKEFKDTPYRLHKPEGAMFFWLWFENLPISCLELYERLKNKGVLIISGHFFFPGMEDDEWQHKHECIRLNYSQKNEQVQKGIKIIAEEIKSLYSKK